MTALICSVVGLGHGTHVCLIGAPSKYSSRHIFNKLVDFKEENFPLATHRPFLFKSKPEKYPIAYSQKVTTPGYKNEGAQKEKKWCNAVFTPGPCAYIGDSGVNGASNMQ